MKKRHSFWLRALCAGLALCTGLSAFSLGTLAADSSDAPNGTELVNKYKRSNPTAKIAVNAGDVVYFGPAICWGTYVHMKAWSAADASATLVSDITPSTDGVEKVDSFGYYDIYSYTVPDGVAAVSVNDTRLYPSVYMVTINQKLTKKNFNEYWENQNSRVLSSHGQKFETKTSVLTGKSALFLGDSLTDASRDESTYYHSWAGRIGDVNGMDWVNAGVDGASITSLKSVDKQFVTQLNKNSDRTFDYVMIWGGINDAWISAPIGSVSESTDPASFDTETFAGALEDLFYRVKTSNPNAICGYIIMYPIIGLNEGRLSDWPLYAAEAIKVCEKWNVPYLDLCNDTAFCNDELMISTTLYLPDHVHLDGQGYDLIYPKIEAWMIDITPKPATPETPPSSEGSSPTDTTTVPETTVATEAKKGCGASLSTMTATLTTLCLGGAALLLRKRKKLEA